MGESIFATLPVLDLEAAGSTDPIVFPQIGAGEGLSTQLVLINASAEQIGGEIQLFDDEGQPLELELEGTTGTVFTYVIEGNGVFRGELSREGTALAGYAVVTLTEGSRAPAGSAIFQFKAGQAVVTEAGVAAARATPEARLFIDQAGTHTGVAIASPGNPAMTVTFDLLDTNGVLLEQATRKLAAGGHLAVFVDELFTGLGNGFTGLMEITSDEPIVPVTLKLTTNEAGELVLTTLPVADLTHPASMATLIFPLLGLGNVGGGEFQTRLILINGEKAREATGRLSFFQSDGSGMVVPLGGKTDSQFPYQVTAGGGQQLRPGRVAGAVAQIIIDPANPDAGEVVVNENDTIQLDPLILDGEGNRLEGVSLSYTSLNEQVATVDTLGKIEGKQAGFSTLTVVAKGVIKTATITVVKVTSGVEGFDITGVVQDLARRLYLANTGNHTVLLAKSLQATLDSRHLTPTAVAFDSPTGVGVDPFGNIYVSQPASGQVRIILTNGEVAQAVQPNTFIDPRGIVISKAGELVVADGSRSLQQITYGEPEITKVTPEQISSTGGAMVTIEGKNFSPDTLVVLADVVLSDLEVLDSQTISVNAPRLSTGRTNLTVQNRGGLAQTSFFVQAVALRDLPPWHITTVAGGSTFTGDGADARAAPVAPVGITIDAAGNLFVVDSLRNGVRKISASNGIITTVAGNGSTESSGDGDLATAAGLFPIYPGSSNFIIGIALDAAGNLFVADIGYNRIRKIEAATGIISTVAGNGESGFSGDNGPATAASLNRPNAVVVDAAGNLFISDSLNYRVRKVDVRTGIMTTVGGTGEMRFPDDGGPAAASALLFPRGLVFDSAGNLFIADSSNSRIRKVDPDGIITTVAGNNPFSFSGDNGPARDADLSAPGGLAVDTEGNLFIADTSNHRIRRIDTAGVITTVAGNSQPSFVAGFSGDGGPATAALLNYPEGIAVDAEGNLIIADTDNHRIRKVDAATGIITTVLGDGTATVSTLDSPSAVAHDLAGNLLIVDTGNHRILKLDAQGMVSSVLGTGQAGFCDDSTLAASVALSFPEGIAVDSAGNLVISDNTSHRILKVGPVGTVSTVAGNCDSGFSGDNGPAADAPLSYPEGIAMDTLGNLFIADTDNNRIRAVRGPIP